jgi:PAS domain S-box-containing protein
MLNHAHAELQGAEYVVFADANRRYTDCSEAVCRLLGYSRQELMRMTIDNVSYSADVSKASSNLYGKVRKTESSC